MLKKIFKIVLYIVIAVMVLYTILGLINYNNAKNDIIPSYYITKHRYTKETKTITEYNYLIYKVVQVDDSESNIVSFKLWFFDN